jgi:prepilin-type N-terminal cleavage/methylation domain-containing protein
VQEGGSAGFSLIETLVALVILVAGFLLVQQSVSLGWRGAHAAFAERSAVQPPESFVGRTAEAERRKVELDAGAVEDAQHHALSQHGRHGRDAQVDRLAAHGGFDAAVLRQPALGDRSYALPRTWKIL